MPEAEESLVLKEITSFEAENPCSSCSFPFPLRGTPQAQWAIAVGTCTRCNRPPCGAGRSVDPEQVDVQMAFWVSSTSNKCLASSNKCLTSSNKKLLDIT